MDNQDLLQMNGLCQVSDPSLKKEVWDEKLGNVENEKAVNLTDPEQTQELTSVTSVIRSVLRDFPNPILMSKTKQLRQIARDNPETKKHSPAEITGRVLEALRGAKQAKRALLGTIFYHLYEMTMLGAEKKISIRILAANIRPILFEPTTKVLQETIPEAQRRTAEECRIIELMINVALDLCPQLLSPEPESAKLEFIWLKKKLASLAALKN